MSAFSEALGQRILVCDGAMGTMLHTAGMSLDRALSELNLSNPGLVRAVHDSYVASGADVIQTNTFGANPLRLAVHGCADQAREINLWSSRQVRTAGPRSWPRRPATGRRPRRRSSRRAERPAG